MTIAHEAIAKAVHQHTGMPVWMMPCFGHLFGKKVSPAEHRWAMLELVAPNHRYMSLCDYEIRTEASGAMYDTLKAFDELYPDITFHVVIGMDNANSVFQWHRGEELIHERPFIVMGRFGVQPTTDWYCHPPHTYIPMKIGLSSTDVRGGVESGKHKCAKSLVSPAVWDYIVQHDLYGYKGGKSN